MTLLYHIPNIDNVLCVFITYPVFFLKSSNYGTFIVNSAHYPNLVWLINGMVNMKVELPVLKMSTCPACKTTGQFSALLDPLFWELFH